MTKEQAEGGAAWQPIENAPKDGTHILLARRRLRKDEYVLGEFEIIIGAYLSVWTEENKQWVGINVGSLNGSDDLVSELTIRGDWGEVAASVGPTHWMPLPEPPAALTSARSTEGE